MRSGSSCLFQNLTSWPTYTHIGPLSDDLPLKCWMAMEEGLVLDKKQCSLYGSVNLDVP